jgi:hypothetical protein
MNLLRIARVTPLIALLSASSWTIVQAETGSTDTPVHLTIRDSDRTAASHASNLSVHKLARAGATISHARTTPLKESLASLKASSNGHFVAGSLLGAKTESETAVSALTAVPAPGFYPADLTYSGGPVIQYAAFHNIYVDGTASDWGNPDQFVTDLFKSEFIQSLDQYLFTTASNRYKRSTSATIDYPIYTTLGDNDLFQILHASAAVFGSSYGAVYNIFLPQGVDYCEGSECYSPDNPSTFAFCAFHGAVQFQDIGLVLFTLEPYQNVSGCAVEQPTPNGALVDSTASILSHETSETLTDPVDGTGWTAAGPGLAVYGEEIGDICQSFDPNTFIFENPVSVLNGTPYSIQLEYSNKYHACSNVK